MVKSHAKTKVFSLTANSPSTHVRPSKGSNIIKSTMKFLQCCVCIVIVVVFIFMSIFVAVLMVHQYYFLNYYYMYNNYIMS